jgi:branched-chain amino acid transport system permease protein
MNLNFWLIQTFNGISYGALLFLVGSGLSLIFGVMRIVNLSHGSYFLLGGYVALSVIWGAEKLDWTTAGWLVALPTASLCIAAVGLLMERLFLRSSEYADLRNALIGIGAGLLIYQPIGGGPIWLIGITVVTTAVVMLTFRRISIVPIEADPLRQVLLTVGFAFLFQQAALDIWSGNNFDINPPDALSQSIVVGGLFLPLYRIFMIAAAIVIGLGLWLAMERTRLGAAVRATVDDAQMARGVGIDTSRISMMIFSLGAFLAALGGVIGGAFLGIYPGLDFEMLPLAFAVVIIGGMGSLGGAAIGALAVGLADNFGKALFPEISYFTLYAPMALILAIKPTGLFGRE